ncbi:MAG: SurA N-terminal domain-containing protein [Rikenellaceae bacterium]|nr:SurA N-terminal domain-containing protein [Rikenellaceae bacterium]
MATLNTLRTKGGWIVTAVIGLALLAFLLGDLASGNSVFGIKEKVGKIDGTSMTYLEYAQKVESITDINKILSGNESMTAEQQDQLRNYAWETLINEIAIFPGLQELGIQVTDDEMLDRIYGNNISQVLYNFGFFNDGQGGIDKAALQSFVSNLDADPTGNAHRIWQYIKEQVYQDALMSKYYTLVGKMPYVTDAEASTGADRASVAYNARYVVQPYSAIADSTVTVSASEVRKYYDAHKEAFKQVATRSIEYVKFDVLPSVEDYAEARSFVDQLTREFAVAENLPQYVSLNSHEGFNSGYFTRDQLPAALAEYAFNPNREEVYGPVMEGDTYTITRVNDLRSFSDTLGMRQMAFMPGTEALADSVLNELKKGGDFMTLAAEFSVIPVDQVDMGRLPTQFLPMEIGEVIYSSREPYIKYEAPGGIFLFDVYYRGPESPKVQLAEVVYHVEPSVTTQQAAYAKASGFYTATNGQHANFDRIAADSVYTKRTATVQAGQTRLSGLESGREVIRWAFNSKPGTISNIMEMDNSYVIAVLTEATEHGYAPVESVSSQIANELRIDKKAEMLAAQMQGAASLEALAQTLGAEVQDVEDVTYTTFYLTTAGFEPALIGAICGGMPEGQPSRPVKGMNGVYVAEITSKTPIEATNMEMERVRLEAQDETSLAQRAASALLQKTNVVDERSKYF